MRRTLHFALLGLFFTGMLYAVVLPDDNRAGIISESATAIDIHFDLSEVTTEEIQLNGVNYLTFAMQGEGYTQKDGYPKLPAISRYVECNLLLAWQRLNS